jgi:hypothetical protein
MVSQSTALVQRRLIHETIRVKRTHYILLWLLAVNLQAAGQTAPPGQTQVATGLDSADVITWRPLGQSDFRGARPPGAFGTSSVRPVAVSCAYVVTSPQARIFPVEVPGAEAVVSYRAVVEGLSFHALLSRSCSWWNPNTGVSPAYVLQHEQLHFDIFEIAARRLNRDLPGLLEVMDVRGPTVQSVVDGAQQHVQAALTRALNETAARNQKLDIETSFGFEPTRQAGWRMQIKRDLQELEPYGAPMEELTPKAMGK